jgi:hypothetical protein
LLRFEFMGVHLGLRVSGLNIQDWILDLDWLGGDASPYRRGTSLAGRANRPR